MIVKHRSKNDDMIGKPAGLQEELHQLTGSATPCAMDDSAEAFGGPQLTGSVYPECDGYAARKRWRLHEYVNKWCEEGKGSGQSVW